VSQVFGLVIILVGFCTSMQTALSRIKARFKAQTPEEFLRTTLSKAQEVEFIKLNIVGKINKKARHKAGLP
jgi:hypothetical protein